MQSWLICLTAVEKKLLEMMRKFRFCEYMGWTDNWIIKKLLLMVNFVFSFFSVAESQYKNLYVLHKKIYGFEWGSSASLNWSCWWLSLQWYFIYISCTVDGTRLSSHFYLFHAKISLFPDGYVHFKDTFTRDFCNNYKVAFKLFF